MSEPTDAAGTIGPESKDSGNALKTPTAKGLRALRWLRSRRVALGVLVAFSLVAWAKPMGLLLWARIRILTNIPKTAIADDPANVAAEPPPPEELDAGLGRPAAGDLDPFRVDPAMLPAHVQPEPAPVRAPETPSAPAAAPPVPIEPPPPSAEELRALRSAAIRRSGASLRLQSAGRGLSMAVIEGRTLRVGDLVEAADGVTLRLVEVREGAAVLECEGERVEIRLRGQPVDSGSRGGTSTDPQVP